MAAQDPKNTLHRYLRNAREALLWKLEGLSEYDVRRPLTPTGTNLLGLVKHLTAVELGYFGDTFGRPFGEPLAWEGLEDEPNIDFWATAEESREQIIGQYERACAHADKTIDELTADSAGRVPWWPPEHNEVTLHQILVHMVAEVNRHAGHADIVRELIDGTAGLAQGRENLPEVDQEYWAQYRAKLERLASEAAS
jgi:uncharacterized damage-inducible protein DinB